MVVELAQKLEIKESDRYLEQYCLNQIKAAPYTLQVIRSLNIIEKDPSLTAVKETDVYQLKRRLCLPCAAATCINKLKGERIIGDEGGALRVGDFFKYVLPLHRAKGVIDPNTGKEFPKGWLVVTPKGDVYHHAIIAFAQALGVTGKAVRNFESITEFSPIITAGGTLAVSLDNRFVIEQTLKNNPELVAYGGNPNKVQPKILTKTERGYDYREFQEGRHSVAVLDFFDNQVILSDSFFLPQMQGNLLMKLDTKLVDHYLDYKTGGLSQGIIFSLDPEVERLISPQYLFPIAVPEDKVRIIRKGLR